MHVLVYASACPVLFAELRVSRLDLRGSCFEDGCRSPSRTSGWPGTARERPALATVTFGTNPTAWRGSPPHSLFSGRIPVRTEFRLGNCNVLLYLLMSMFTRCSRCIKPVPWPNSRVWGREGGAEAWVAPQFCRFRADPPPPPAYVTRATSVTGRALGAAVPQC